MAMKVIFNQEVKRKKKIEGYKARRWVAERGFAWIKGYRSVRTRYCQKHKNFQSVVSIACSTISDKKGHAGHTT